MPRIVVYFIDSHTFGGTEQALLHLMANLDRRRWQPVLYHHNGPGIVPLIEKARQLDVQTRVVPILKGNQTISGLPRFFRQLSLEKPAVFHAHLNWLLSCKYGILAAALSRIPVVATVQQFMDPPWGKSIEIQQYLLSRCVDRYIAVSNAVAGQLSKTFHVPAHKIQVIPNCIPIDRNLSRHRFSLRSEFGIDEERPLILTVARLDKQKGHPFLFEALCQVPEATLVLAGSGPERKALEALSADLGIHDRVIFLGHREDIHDLLACSDLFVLPSIYEGLPLSILEAMDAGKAVIATAVGGTPEAVSDGETGLLVPRRDSTALASAMRKLISDPTMRLRMGKAGKERVRQEFSVNNMVQGVTQVYERLLDQTQKPIGPEVGNL